MSGSYATTPNFALKKPVTGADDDLWGTHWNQNADTLDATLKLHADAIDANAPVGGPFLPMVGGNLSGPGNLGVGGTLNVTGASALSRTLNVTPNTTNTNTLILTQPATATAPFIFTASSGPATSGGLFFNAGPIQFNRTYTYSGTSSPANCALRGAWTINGTATDAQATGINYFQIDDNLVTPPNYQFVHFGVFSRVNAPSAGTRIAFQSSINQTATGMSGPAGINPGYVSFQTVASAGHNEGGTAGVGNGNAGVWGSIVGAFLNAGATYFNGNVGVEYDIQVAAGASVQRNRAIQVTMVANHKTRGTYIDDAIGIGAVAGAISLKTGINFGANADEAAFDASSTLLYSEYPHTHGATYNVGWGIDWQQPTFTGGLLRSRGISIDGAGTVQVGTGLVKAIAGGLSIDAAGAIGTGTPTVAAGGSGWKVGDMMRDANGGIYSVATVSGSIIATLAVPLVQPTTPTASTPANPIAVTAFGTSDGTGATLNLTWDSTRTALAIQSTAGGKLGFNGATPVVKPTVTGSKGANAALASLLAALAGYGLVTDSST